MLYDTVKISQPKTTYTADFGAKPSETVDKVLFEIDEPELVERMVESSAKPLRQILDALGIDFHNCWIATNVPTKQLIDEAVIHKLLDKMPEVRRNPVGDIDLIIGKIEKDKFVFEHGLIALQVKIRRMEAAEKLRRFASGEGTSQAHFTAFMGFDRTCLLHIFVREPKPVTSRYAASWNPITNSDFSTMMRASYKSVRDRLNRALYGYAWMGWGQAYGKEPEECGGLKSDIVIEPPVRPKADDKDVCVAREMVVKSMASLLNMELRKKGGLIARPFVLKCPIRP